MKLVILVTVVAAAAAMTKYPPERGMVPEATKMMGIGKGKDTENGVNSEPMPFKEPMGKEDTNEQEPSEEDTVESVEPVKEVVYEAPELKSYQLPGPTRDDQPIGPKQIYDPAPAAFDIMYAAAPSSNEAKIHAYNAKRQAAVNLIAKNYYKNPPKEAYNVANHNGAHNRARYGGYIGSYNHGAHYGAPNLGYFDGYRHGYYGGYNSPRGYGHGYNHRYNDAQRSHVMRYY